VIFRVFYWEFFVDSLMYQVFIVLFVISGLYNKYLQSFSLIEIKVCLLPNRALLYSQSTVLFQGFETFISFVIIGGGIFWGLI
jgi:hypothetical protein